MVVTDPIIIPRAGINLMKHLFLTLFCLISLSSMATEAPPFPIATGTAWVYSADVKTEAEGKELSETLTWTTEINSVIVWENMIIAKGSGLPTDLAFYEKGKKPAPFLMIMAGPWRLYVVQNEEKIKEAWEKAIAGESLAESVTEADLLLDFPLVEEKPFGETSQLVSGIPMYCYRVEGKAPFAAEAVKGLNASGALDEVSIAYAASTDSTTWKFAHGVGFIGYIYSHHGSTSEVNCRLVEFRPGK